MCFPSTSCMSAYWRTILWLWWSAPFWISCLSCLHLCDRRSLPHKINCLNRGAHLVRGERFFRLCVRCDCLTFNVIFKVFMSPLCRGIKKKKNSHKVVTVCECFEFRTFKEGSSVGSQASEQLAARVPLFNCCSSNLGRWWVC